MQDLGQNNYQRLSSFGTQLIVIAPIREALQDHENQHRKTEKEFLSSGN